MPAWPLWMWLLVGGGVAAVALVNTSASREDIPKVYMRAMTQEKDVPTLRELSAKMRAAGYGFEADQLDRRADALSPIAMVIQKEQEQGQAVMIKQPSAVAVSPITATSVMYR